MKPDKFEIVHLPKDFWVSSGYFYSHTKRPDKYKDWFGPNHEPVWVYYPHGKNYFPVDKEIFPLLRALWACDFYTGACCQDGHLCFRGEPRLARTILDKFVRDAIIVFDDYNANGYIAYWGKDKKEYCEMELKNIIEKELPK